MAFGSGARQWVRGTLIKIAASTAVLGQGEVLVDEAGGLYAGDGATQIKNLKRAVRQGELLLNVRDYGAKGDGATADYTAIAAALAAVPQVTTVADAYDGVTARPRMATLYFPDGVYLTASAIVLPQNVNVLIAPGATIKATASMTAVLDTAVGTTHQDGFIDCQGVIDCNSLASYGIYLRKFARYILRTPRIYSPAAAGVVLGDPSASTVSYEGQVIDPYVWRPNIQAVPSGSIGVWLQNATDSYVGGSGSVILGCDIGTRNDKNNNSFKSVHVWGYPPNGFNSNTLALLPSTCFLDNAAGGNYTDCYADSPSAYGWRFTLDNPRSSMNGCRLYNAGGCTDNVIVAVQVDASTTGNVACFGLNVSGAGGSVRVASDFAGNLGATTRLGTRNFNVVTPQGDSSSGASVGVLSTVSTSTTLTSAQVGALVNSTGQVTITLPVASSVTTGKTYVVKIASSNGSRCSVNVASSGTIDGRGSVDMDQGDGIQVYSDGTTWRTIARSFSVAVAPAPALTTPAVSGTAYQNTTGRTLFVSVAYTPTGAGDVKLELSRDGTTYVTYSDPIFSGSGSTQYLMFMLPEQWFYKATATGATLGVVVQAG